MKRLFHIGVLATAVLLSSCSLFKFSVNTGDKPLPAADLNMRMMTRGFYYEFCQAIVSTADSLIAATPDADLKIRALRWKIEATSACTATAMQTLPEVALLDTWVLCRQMDTLFRTAPDSMLFGPLTPIARQTASHLNAKAARLAAEVLTPERYTLMANFIDDYCREHPPGTPDLTGDNLMLEWVQYLGDAGKNYVKTVGAVSEVMADIGERTSSYMGQLSNSISWYKEMVELRLEQDSIRDRLALQLDSLANDFRKMVLILEHTPEIADAIGANLNTQMSALIGTLNRSVDDAFRDIDHQRTELQRFVAEQRALIMQEARQAADATLRSALDALPGMIGSILFYVILGGVVLFSIPFGLGFLLGHLRGRSKGHRSGNQAKDPE